MAFNTNDIRRSYIDQVRSVRSGNEGRGAKAKARITFDMLDRTKQIVEDVRRFESERFSGSKQISPDILRHRA